MLHNPACSKFCRHLLANKLPVTQWLPNYNIRKLQADIIAGIVVGFVVVPQSLALATVAGLPPHYGLYSSFSGPFVYCLLGTSRDINVGPTLLAALATGRYNVLSEPRIATIMAFVTGAILLLAGLLQMGFIVRFVSAPVFSGFISATSISLTVNLFQDVLGLPSGPRPFFLRLRHILTNIKQSRLADSLLGVTCFLILMLCNALESRNRRKDDKQTRTKARVFRILNISKNIIVVVVATISSYLLYISGHPDVFILVGKLPRGFPRVENPLQPTGISANRTMSVKDVVVSLGPGIGALPLIMFLESIAIGKALGTRSNYEVDSSQELVAIGASNIISSFFQAFPITGSFGRSVVNNVSGAASPLSGVFSAVLVIMALEFITPVFQYIPISALCAMIAASVLSMVDLAMPRTLWNSNRKELIPYLVSFCACFYEIEAGLVAGMLTNLCYILYKQMRPVLLAEQVGVHVLNLTIKGDLLFPSTESIIKRLRSLLTQADGREGAHIKHVNIDLSDVFEVDVTAGSRLAKAICELRGQGIMVTIVNEIDSKVEKVLTKSGLILQDDKASKIDSEEEAYLCYESNV